MPSPLSGTACQRGSKFMTGEIVRMRVYDPRIQSQAKIFSFGPKGETSQALERNSYGHPFVNLSYVSDAGPIRYVGAQLTTFDNMSEVDWLVARDVRIKDVGKTIPLEHPYHSYPWPSETELVRLNGNSTRLDARKATRTQSYLRRDVRIETTEEYLHPWFTHWTKVQGQRVVKPRLDYPSFAYLVGKLNVTGNAYELYFGRVEPLPAALPPAPAPLVHPTQALSGTSRFGQELHSNGPNSSTEQPSNALAIKNSSSASQPPVGRPVASSQSRGIESRGSSIASSSSIGEKSSLRSSPLPSMNAGSSLSKDKSARSLGVSRTWPSVVSTTEGVSPVRVQSTYDHRRQDHSGLVSSRLPKPSMFPASNISINSQHIFEDYQKCQRPSTNIQFRSSYNGNQLASMDSQQDTSRHGSIYHQHQYQRPQYPQQSQYYNVHAQPLQSEQLENRMARCSVDSQSANPRGTASRIEASNRFAGYPPNEPFPATHGYVPTPRPTTQILQRPVPAPPSAAIVTPEPGRNNVSRNDSINSDITIAASTPSLESSGLSLSQSEFPPLGTDRPHQRDRYGDKTSRL